MEGTLKNVRKENHELAEIVKNKEKDIITQGNLLKEKDVKIEKLKVSCKESKIFG